MRWIRIFLGIVCVVSITFAEELSTDKLNEILNEIAKVEEEIMNEKTKLLSKPSKNLQEELKLLQGQLDEIKRIKNTIESYKKRLENGTGEVSLPPVVRNSSNVSGAIASLLGEEVEPDVAYAGKEGTVLSFVGSKGAVYVYGEVKEVSYYDDYGDKIIEDRFYPRWGIYIDERTEVLIGEEEGSCVYTGRVRFNTPRKVCPLTLTIKGLGNIKTDGDVLYGEIRLGVFDTSFESKKISEIGMFAKIVPEGVGSYIGKWDNRFHLYTRPTIVIDIQEVYIDRERVDFVNDLIRMRVEKEER